MVKGHLIYRIIQLVGLVCKVLNEQMLSNWRLSLFFLTGHFCLSLQKNQEISTSLDATFFTCVLMNGMQLHNVNEQEVSYFTTNTIAAKSCSLLSPAGQNLKTNSC